MGNKMCGMSGRRAVAERLTRPQRLLRQPSDVDYKKLKKLILSRKLAPCFDAIDDPDQFVNCDLEECPICFLYFPSLNRSRCCTKGICTECFLQMKPSNSSKPAQCPFCKTSCYAVEYRGARTVQEKNLEQQEEQKVIEAKIRMQCASEAENIDIPITRPQTILDVLHSFPNRKATSFGQSEHEEKEHIGNSTLHEDVDVDSEVMIMESIWQSLQVSGLHVSESTPSARYISNQEVFGTNQIDRNQYKKFMIESSSSSLSVVEQTCISVP